MISFTRHVFSLLVLMAIASTHCGLAVYVDVIPYNVYGPGTDQVTVQCSIDDSEDLNQALALTVGQSERGLLASLTRGREMKYGANRTAKMQADGAIVLNDKNGTESYLTLTIKDPEIKDRGTYWCRVYYEDTFGQLKEEEADSFLFVDPCPAGWRTYEDDMTCLRGFGRYREKLLNWEDARRACQKQGGDLVVIKDEQKNMFIYNNVVNELKSWPWIGLKNHNIYGFKFKYVDGSVLGSYHPWRRGYPDGGGEGTGKCVIMASWRGYQGKWEDVYCTNTGTYVCSIASLQ